MARVKTQVNSSVKEPSEVLISFVIPVHNEEAAIQPFLDSMRAVLEEMPTHFGFEYVFVNDGSKDGTEIVIRGLQQNDSELRLVNLSRNFGKEAALCAGLDHTKGAAVIPIDVDLQDPPSAIPEMISKWQAGAQVVNARRGNRETDTWFKRQTAGMFYKVFNFLADQPIPSNVGDFRLLDRQVVEVLTSIGERVRFNKAIFSWVGFQTDEVVIERGVRSEGASAWTYWRLWNLALDAIFSSSTKPLRVWTYVGFTISALSFIYAAYILVWTLIFGVDVPGYASTVLMILTFGGLNLFAIGILGEYIGRIFTEVRERPLYVIRSIHESEGKS